MSDAIGSVGKDLEATASRARRAGVDKSRIVVDPGIGFGKRKEQNSEILAQLGRLAELGFPILIGPSRKSFLAQASDGETVFATAAAVTASILNGAHIVRVHDVKEMRAVAQIADEIGRLSAPPANKSATGIRPPWNRSIASFQPAFAFISAASLDRRISTTGCTMCS